MKKQITKFDLDDAFKALNDIEVPKASKRLGKSEALHEQLKKTDKFEALFEDYYDVQSGEDLEAAKDEREDEVAKAKLAKIEKIVDLDAESPEDLQPSYAGKVIVQCPQCMTLFYKNPEDLIKDENDPDTVNVGEICPNCSNDSGYMVIGKVAPVEENEMDQFEAEEKSEEASVEEEQPAEETKEETEEELPAAEETEEETEEEVEMEPSEGKEEGSEDKEEKTEALHESAVDDELVDVSEYVNKLIQANKLKDSMLYLDLAKSDEKNNKYFATKEKADLFKQYCEHHCNESLNESADKELDKKLEAHNEYIAYLQKMIEQEEEALKSKEAEENELVKAAIQRRLDAFKEDLKNALPEEIKVEVEEKEDLPTPEDNKVEVEEKEEVEETKSEDVKEESLKESVVEDELNAFIANLDEDCSPEEATENAEKLADYEENIQEDIQSKQEIEADKKAIQQAGNDIYDTLEKAGLMVDGNPEKAYAKYKELTGKEVTDKKAALEFVYDDLKKHESCNGEHCDEIKECDGAACKEKDLEEAHEVSDKEFKAMLDNPVFNEGCEEVKEDLPAGIEAATETAVDKIEAAGDEVEDEKEPEFDIEEVEDLDENSLDEHLSQYMTEVYDNIENFKTTGCQIKEGKLVVEGAINFKSGKTKNTEFVFEAAGTKYKPVFEGYNKDLAEGKAFTLECIGEAQGKMLIAEKLSYKYNIDKNLVEGFTK